MSRFKKLLYFIIYFLCSGSAYSQLCDKLPRTSAAYYSCEQLRIMNNEIARKKHEISQKYIEERLRVREDYNKQIWKEIKELQLEALNLKGLRTSSDGLHLLISSKLDKIRLARNSKLCGDLESIDRYSELRVSLRDEALTANFYSLKALYALWLDGLVAECRSGLFQYSQRLTALISNENFKYQLEASILLEQFTDYKSKWLLSGEIEIPKNVSITSNFEKFF